MATFTPKSEEELNEGADYELLEPGEYDFEVTKAEDARSKTGNDTIKLTLSVFEGSRKYMVWDYLTFTESGQWKPYSFCKATGLVDKFKAGELLAIDCQNRSGSLKIGIQPAKDQFDAKNIVKHYIDATPKKDLPPAREATPSKPLNPADDDSIPF